MKKAIIMKGLSWSGKSTLSEKYKEEWYQIFSRDQARLDNPGMKESEISNLEREFVLEWYDKIVIDNCHMRKPSLDKIRLFCEWNWYKINIIDMYSEFKKEDPLETISSYLNTCFKRNSKRECHKRVPDSVIYQMYLQNYELQWDKEWYVIVDVDWTIADLSHRLHYLEETPKNHDAFYEHVDKDTPIEKVIDIVRYLSQKHFIVITSGRRNQCCEKTVEWLKKHRVPYDALLMRPWWDRRPDTEVKKEIYDKCLANKDVIMCIDDRPSLVRMRKSMWLFTIDVNQREWEF